MRNRISSAMNRRDFLKTSVAGTTAFSAMGKRLGQAAPPPGTSTVVLIKTKDRAQGVKEVFRLLQIPSPKGRKIFLKPNFNTSDAGPGSTHNETLRQIILELKAREAGRITLGERSGPPQTQRVMADKGIPALAQELGFDILNFENLDEDGWTHFAPQGNHWANGFAIARAAAEAEYFVSTCCLKTHGFGGHFTMSLKLAVGLTPKSLMRELHNKRETDMRNMIAELNQGYKPAFIIMDGVEAFVDGGPSSGKKVDAGVVIGGTDRVAVDAVGVAVLKDLGSNPTIMSRKIFDQDQIKRAVEIGLGVGGPDQIEILTADAAGRDCADKIRVILKEG